MTINSKNAEKEIAAEHEDLITSQAIQLKIRTTSCQGNVKSFFLSNLKSIFFPSQSFRNNDLKFNDYEENFFKFSAELQWPKYNNLPMTLSRATFPLPGSSCELPKPRICKLRPVLESNPVESGGMEESKMTRPPSQKKRKISFILQRKGEENKTFMEIPYRVGRNSARNRKYLKCFFIQFQPGSQIKRGSIFKLICPGFSGPMTCKASGRAQVGPLDSPVKGAESEQPDGKGA